MSGFESLAQILPRVAARGKIADEILALQIQKAFPQSLKSVFRERNLPKVRVGRFSYGTLTISVPDPTWAGLLRQKEIQILERLNASIDRKVVKKLRFRVAAR